MNQFADLTNEEYKSKLNIGTCLLKKPDQKKNIVRLDSEHVPSSVDWRKKGAVTPVKNQGQCGSCWAFSTTGSMEGLNFITNKKLASLSEQQLVDCSESFGNMGCNGGLMDNAFQYTQSKGLETESVYPYTGADGKCKYNEAKVVFTNTGYEDVPQDDNDALAAAVANQPVSIGIEADSMAFQMYTSGVFNDKNCGTNIDHGVLLVGYGGDDEEQNYWIVKNSWGDSWGENGFIKIAKQSGSGTGLCGIASSASYPTYTSSNSTNDSTMEMKYMLHNPVSINLKKEKEAEKAEKAEDKESMMNLNETKNADTNLLIKDIFDKVLLSLKKEDMNADDITIILKKAINKLENPDLNTSIDQQIYEVLKEMNNETSPFYFISSSVNYRKNDGLERIL
jgi:hypothetical protein